jgi:RNA polymerase sigma factor (sigma-70 family)
VCDVTRKRVSGPEVTDWELLRQWKGGNQAASHELVGRYKMRLLGLLRKSLNPADAEEAFQNTWLAFHESIQTIEEEGDSLWPLLAATAYRKAIDLIRKNTRQLRLHSGALTKIPSRAPAPDPFTVLADRENRQRILAVLLARPPVVQQVLVMYWYDGLSIPVIARKTGCTQSTVNRFLAKARNLIRKTHGEEK